MRDNLLDTPFVEKIPASERQPQILIDKLFSEDQDYKMKLASQYDMLSYVGSEIDEVKMDHLSFFKLYHLLQNAEESISYNLTVEFDKKQHALLTTFEDKQPTNIKP